MKAEKQASSQSKPGRYQPLASVQQAVWLDQALNYESPVYNLGYVIEIEAEVDTAIFIEAINRLIRKHDALRIVLSEQEEAMPTQKILPTVSLTPIIQDFSSQNNPEQEIWKYIRQRFNTARDLYDGLLWDSEILRIDGAHYYWVFRFHHLIIDGFGISVFAESLFNTVDKLMAESDDSSVMSIGQSLPRTAATYRHFLKYDQAYLSSDQYEQDRLFWCEKFVDSPPPLFVEARAWDYQQSSSDIVHWLLERGFYQEITAYADTCGGTAFHIFLALISAYFARVQVVDEVVVGIPVLNRNTAEQRLTVGMFASIIPIKIKVDVNRSFGDLVNLVRTELHTCYRHQKFPIVEINRALKLARQGRKQLFDVMLSYEDFAADYAFGNLKYKAQRVNEQFQQVPLNISIRDYHKSDDVAISFNFLTSVFERTDVEVMQSHLKVMLESFLNNSDQRIGELPMMDAVDRQLVLQTWNATEADYSLNTCIHHLFEEQVVKAPDLPALIFETQTVSYQDLNAQANQLAHYLIAQGVGLDMLVAVCMERSIDMVVALLAILKAGCAYVPLDPDYPEQRLQQILNDSQPLCVLVDHRGQECLGNFTKHLTQQGLIHLQSDRQHWSDNSRDNPIVEGLKPNHLAYVIYTSGSTGQPKGVMNEHRGVVNYLQWRQRDYALTAADTVLQKTPYSFDVSVWEFFWPLMAAARLVIARPQGHRDPSYLHQLIESEGVTTVHFVPSMLSAFLTQLSEASCPSVRQIFCSGEALPMAAAKHCLAQLPNTKLYNLYGPTEAAIDATAWHCEADADEMLIGRPIANDRIYILDSHHQPVPIGLAGELYIAGEGVARGYWNRPELTAECFLADPFDTESQSRMYKTGDWGRWKTDGTIEFLGRKDFQVKVHGLRVELGEIEAQLEAIATIKGVVVVAHERDAESCLIAYCLSDDTNLDTERLRSTLLRAFPDYMVPAAYVRVESWPLTTNGKLDRAALPLPDGEAYVRREYEVPGNALEETLARLWAELLGVERVSRWDNFFALGGHSLIAMQLISRLREAGWQLDILSLFSRTTLADLAIEIRPVKEWAVPANGIPTGADGITPEMLTLIDLSQGDIDRIVDTVPGGAANIQDIYPLAPLQEGILFHYLLDGDSDTYLQASLAAFDSRVLIDDFVKALQKLIDRHDILRTSVLWEQLKAPVQVVWRQAPLVVHEIELTDSTMSAVNELRSRFNTHCFQLDIKQAPLLQLAIAFDQRENRWLLSLLQHHLIDDNTSLKHLLDEVQRYLRGESLPTPVPFRQFIAQLQSRDDTEVYRTFFSDMLADFNETTAPFGLLKLQDNDTRLIKESRLRLDKSLTSRLRSATQLEVNTAGLFHLAFAKVLGAISGSEDVVFGTVLFGRMNGGAAAERALGMFINTLPIRIPIGDVSIQASLKQTHQRLVKLLQYEHASLPLVHRCSAVETPQPLFCALLNYRHNPDFKSIERDWQGINILQYEERTHYPLTVSVDDRGDDFLLSVKAAEPIDAGRIGYYLQQVLVQLLDNLEGAAETPCYQLQVLPESEYQQTVYHWNANDRGDPLTHCVPSLFEQQVRHSPDAIALVFQEKRFQQQTLSYQVLNQRANQLAHYLIGRGVRPNSPVGLCADRCVEMVVGLLAILKAGGAYFPLDPAYPIERLRFMLADSAPVLLLTDGSVPTLLYQQDSHPPVIDLLSDHAQWAACSTQNPVIESLNVEHLAYIIYTSGSTGKPKGVMNEHRGLVNHLVWKQEAFSINADDRILQRTPLGFDVSVSEILLSLLSGARLILPGPRGHQDLAELCRTIAEYHVTVLHTVPTVLAVFLDHIDAQQAASLRLISCGGESLSVDLAQRCADHLPHVELHNLYGPTEASIDATAGSYRPSEKMLSIGRPVSNTTIYILDARGFPVPLGAVGELTIGGVGVARGYINQPELTEARFLSDPFSPHSEARMYRTGDLARWNSDGTIDFVGRNDFQIKIRGFRIEPDEIAAQLCACENIDNAVVIADTNSDHTRLLAYCVSDAEALDIKAIRTQLQAQLPDYMVPTVFIKLASLPLTPSGKLDRNALPKPDDEHHTRATYEAPKGEKEMLLVRIWSELFGIERLSRWDNFFALGGHSLMAIQLLSRLRSMAWQLDIQCLFNTPVLFDLARQIKPLQTMDVPTNGIPTGATVIEPEMLTLIDLTPEQIQHITGSVPGGAANIQDIYPLTPLQKGIVFHHLLDGAGDMYLLSTQMAFDTYSNLDAFLKATQTMIDRHDILRTAIYWEGLPEPVQLVQREASLVVEEISVDGEEDALQQLQAQYDPRSYRLNISKAPLIRAVLVFDRQQNRYLLALFCHHLLTDHIASKVMLDEIGMHVDGRGDQLPPPVPYRTIVAHSRFAFKQNTHEDFFQDMLGDVHEPTAPFDVLDVQGICASLSESHRMLTEQCSQSLRLCALDLGVSPSSLFHLAWAQVLACLTGRDDVVFGTVLSGRLHSGEGADRALGMFLNTLPIRIYLGDHSVVVSLEQTNDLLVKLMQHELAPLELALGCSGVDAPLPLFTSLLNYRYNEFGKINDSGIELREGIRLLHVEDKSNYPLDLSIDDFGDVFGLTLQVVHPLPADRICTYMEQALHALLEALQHAPDRPCYQLDILSQEERQQLVERPELVDLEDVEDKCVHTLFEQQVCANPEQVAIIQDGQYLTYNELNTRSNQLAHYLIECGVVPDSRVALCVKRSPALLVGLFAILKAGGAYVPLDPEYPDERLRFILTDSAPLLLLGDGEIDRLFDTVQPDFPYINLHSDQNRWLSYPVADPAVENLQSVHLAYLMYTSGSSGQPKGVMVEHGHLRTLVKTFQQSYGFNSDDRMLQFSAISFDMCVEEIFFSLLSGASLVLRTDDWLINADRFWALCREYRISCLNLPTFFWEQLTKDSQVDIPDCVRHLAIGGDQVARDALSRWFSRSGYLPRLVNIYGPTETTVNATVHEPEPDSPELWDSIGKAIPHTHIYILDERANPVPVGVTGELYIAGAGVSRGYWNHPDLTHKCFLPDPFSANKDARMYKTGDLVRWNSNGSIAFLGRKDNQVKMRGFRIELGEVEAALRRWEGFSEALVTADQSNGETRLLAYYVSEAQSLDIDKLRSHLLEQLPEYAVPVAYIRLDALPLTPNGKLDRKALPAPTEDTYSRLEYEAPHNKLEQALAAIWADVLALDKVGRWDNFFALGGHSLSAMRLIAHSRTKLGIEVALSDLFTQPVLADFANKISRIEPVAITEILKADRSGPIPLSLNQERLWFLAQLGEQISVAYHIAGGIHLNGHLDRDLLIRALNHVVERHEILHTCFVEHSGHIEQYINERDQRFALVIEDLRGCECADEYLQHLLDKIKSAPFDFEQGPLLRGCLIQLKREQHQFFLCMHHIIADGWSLDIFIQEVCRLYSAFAAGQESPLPALSIQYADYAVWQRAYLADEKMGQEIEYWRETLRDAPLLLEIPRDYPRPSRQNYQGAECPLVLEPALTQSLKALSQRLGVTLHVTLLSTWALLLSRLSGQDDVVVGTPVANRARRETESLIGFFINTLALRIDLSGTPSIAELLQRIKSHSLQALSHQNLPFEQVVELLKLEPSLAHAPVFQVLFNWDNTPNKQLDLPGLTWTMLPRESLTLQVDLSLNLSEEDGTISGSLMYARALFKPQTITRFVKYWCTLLSQLVTLSPQSPCTELSLLDVEEQQRMLYGWNNTTLPYSHNPCIHQLFELQVEKTPEAIALVFAGDTLSYCQLNRQANQLAHYLIAQGVQPDTRVGLCVERGIKMVVAILAILKAGGAYVPLDPDYPRERLHFMLADSEPLLLLHDNNGQDHFDQEALTIPAIHLNSGCCLGQPDSNPSVLGLRPDHLAYIIYTSGSTGHPKGVMTEHRNAVNFLNWRQHEYKLTPNDAVLQTAPFSFDISVGEFFWPLMAGGRLVMIKPNGNRDPAYLHQVVKAQEVSILDFVPSLLQVFLDVDPHESYPQVRLIFCGGEALPITLQKQCLEQIPNSELHNVYGPTEVTVNAIRWQCQQGEDSGSVPIGRPIPNMQVYLLDTYGQPAPIGVEAELYIAGAGLSRGYLNRSALTEERFLPNPFSDVPNARFYKTGDLGRWREDGALEFLGRNDFQVKVRGKRIELGEIEAALCLCEGIRDAVVTGNELSGDTQLVAYCVSYDLILDIEYLRSTLLAYLPDYMVPSAYVRLELLPLNHNGKLDRKALPMPAGESYERREYEAPVDEIEIALADIWSSLLEVEQVGRWDNFFTLGGHSLLVIAMIREIKDAMGVNLEVFDIFQAQHLAALTEKIIELQLQQFDPDDVDRLILSLDKVDTNFEKAL
ncbi:non-ribosomal peptide synthetase [Microbulbifer sp. 2205BS26-8]|uniref:non-ribosomal peptide synthetase n=1 Tax=Microbulbifer sp. 2205BS26-8 TaxID=3064386 RepID=UPI00273E0CCE|nr:non-ribosomal peptide synthetase [Microbulbifer sp. 2205BS26-8]MDP5209828.1 amino acid adenylation domain-containing protein [Microbulbifer sp. 2205BS26-8]